MATVAMFYTVILGFPYIRGTRGSSYDDACSIETLRIDIYSLIASESLVDSVRAQFL